MVCDEVCGLITLNYTKKKNVSDLDSKVDITLIYSFGL